LAAIRRASALVSSLDADRRPGLYPLTGALTGGATGFRMIFGLRFAIVSSSLTSSSIAFIRSCVNDLTKSASMQMFGSC
jgi:hypothetical protein